jgi:integrase
MSVYFFVCDQDLTWFYARQRLTTVHHCTPVAFTKSFTIRWSHDQFLTLVKAMALNDAKISGAKARGKEFGLSDGEGLYLLVQPSGTRSWSFRYTDPQTKKPRKMGLGGYPQVSLVLARDKAQVHRSFLAQGLDPKFEQEKARQRAILEKGNTFAILAEAWLKREERIKKCGDGKTKQTIQAWLDNHILPYIGQTPILDLKRSDIARLLERVVEQQLKDTPQRCRSVIARVFDYAIEFADFPEEKNFMRGRNVGGLVSQTVKHHASLLDKEKIGQLMRDIKAYKGYQLTRVALRIFPYVWQRPGMIRKMHWEHLDLDDSMWRVPAASMKMRRDHEVPLPRQAVALLRDLQPLTGASGRGPVFPNMTRAKEKKSPYMSDATVNKALRSMGYDTQEDITGHGFRSMARTILPQELGIPAEWAERHLAHSIKDPNGEAYDRAKYVEQRRQMIQMWADWLDGLADGKQPTPAPMSESVI